MHKKVCILTSVHPLLDTRIFQKQAKTLAKAGYEVVLIVQHDRDEIVDDIKIIALPRPRNRLCRVLGTWRIFKLAVSQKAAIYHFHDPELLPAGMLLKLTKRGKVIYDVHENYGKQILSKYYLFKPTRIFIARFIVLIEKFTSRFFDAIIAATDDIQKKFTKHRQTIIVHNYPVLSPLNISIPKKTDDVFRVIYAGAITKERGISKIVEAMEYIKSNRKLKLILYGTFAPATYETQLKKLSGYRHVEYHGWIEQEKLWAEMIHADAGITQLGTEQKNITALPTKLFECMAAGLPVITSDFPLRRKIVEENNCGLIVNPSDIRGIARSIQYLIDHPDKATIMGQNGRKAIEDKYSWESESRKLLLLYQKLTGDYSNSSDGGRYEK